jgi:hypothetical protein
MGTNSTESTETPFQTSSVELTNYYFGFLGNQLMQSSIFLIGEKDKKSMAVEDIISRVRGGSSGWGGGLTQNSSTITYRYWGRSLKYNPVVIDFEVSLFAVEEPLRP